MYSVREAVKGEHWYVSTSILLKGKLVYAREWRPPNFLYFHVLRDNVWHGERLEVIESDIMWAPTPPSGYLNIGTHTYWMSVSGVRNYKVGISERSLYKRSLSIARLGTEEGVDLKMLHRACNGRIRFPASLDRARTLLRGSAEEAVGLTYNLGLHRIPGNSNANALVVNAQRVVGILDEEGAAMLTPDTDIDLPKYLRRKDATTESLVAAFTSRS